MSSAPEAARARSRRLRRVGRVTRQVFCDSSRALALARRVETRNQKWAGKLRVSEHQNREMSGEVGAFKLSVGIAGLPLRSSPTVAPCRLAESTRPSARFFGVDAARSRV